MKVLFGILTIMAGLGAGTADGRPIYVTCTGSGTVEEFDSSGNLDTARILS